MTVSYQKWRDELLPFLPSCPEVQIDWAVRSAAIEFCDRTWITRYQMDPTTIVSGVATYDLDAPTYTEVCGIYQVYFGNVRLLPRSPEQLASLYAGGDWRSQSGAPRYFTREPDDIDLIRVCPTPDAAAVALGDTLKIIVAVKPTRDATECNEVLWRNWMEEIAAGAKAKIMATPQQDYSDPKMAAIYRQQFVSAIGKGKIEVMRGQANATVVARPPDMRVR